MGAAYPHFWHIPPCSCSPSDVTTLSRLASFEVRAGNVPGYSPANPVCAFVSAGGNGSYTVACAPPLVGRYVSVRLPPGYTRVAGEAPRLQLCEVQVMATLPLVSVGKPASQSSTAVPGVTDASEAVDGGLSQTLAAGSCTRTNSDSQPWW